MQTPHDYNPYQAPQSDMSYDESNGEYELLEEPNRLSASAGIDWVGQSWRIFRARPLLWIGLVFAYLGFIFLIGILGLIPIIGALLNIAIGIFFPMIMAGVYYIAYNIDTDNDVSFGDVLVAFRSGKLGDYFMLWLWQFLLTLGLMIPVAILFFGLIATGFNPEDSGLGLILLLLVVLALILPLLMVAIFSPILILFHDMKAWDAMKLSMRACLANMLPFLLYGIVFAILFLIASIPFGLGLLIVAPMAMASIYVAYRQILTNS